MVFSRQLVVQLATFFAHRSTIHGIFIRLSSSRNDRVVSVTAPG